MIFTMDILSTTAPVLFLRCRTVVIINAAFAPYPWPGERVAVTIWPTLWKMLSSILNSDVAIEVNIRIIRVFTKLREYALTHKDILLQLGRLEKEVKGNSRDIENIFMVLKELIEKHSTPAPRNKIGFKQYD